MLLALGELLNDPRSSRVRYRAAELLRSSPTLVPTYEDDLGRLAKADANPYVRELAATALRMPGADTAAARVTVATVTSAPRDPSLIQVEAPDHASSAVFKRSDICIQRKV